MATRVPSPSWWASKTEPIPPSPRRRTRRYLPRRTSPVCMAVDKEPSRPLGDVPGDTHHAAPSKLSGVAVRAEDRSEDVADLLLGGIGLRRPNDGRHEVLALRRRSP